MSNIESKEQIEKIEEKYEIDYLVKKVLEAAKNGEIKYDPDLEIHETELEV